jgi:hypothetical protein
MEEESGDQLAPILRDADELSRRRSSTRPTCFFATVRPAVAHRDLQSCHTVSALVTHALALPIPL